MIVGVNVDVESFLPSDDIIVGAGNDAINPNFCSKHERDSDITTRGAIRASKRQLESQYPKDNDETLRSFYTDCCRPFNIFTIALFAPSRTFSPFDSQPT